MPKQANLEPCPTFIKVCNMSFTASDQNMRTVWNPLRQAIAESSGFQEWRQSQEQEFEERSTLSLDVLVHRYLKETLATLAY